MNSCFLQLTVSPRFRFGTCFRAIICGFHYKGNAAMPHSTDTGMAQVVTLGAE